MEYKRSGIKCKYQSDRNFYKNAGNVINEPGHFTTDAKNRKEITAHDNDIRLIFEALKQLLDPPHEQRKRIGFKPDN